MRNLPRLLGSVLLLGTLLLPTAASAGSESIQLTGFPDGVRIMEDTPTDFYAKVTNLDPTYNYTVINYYGLDSSFNKVGDFTLTGDATFQCRYALSMLNDIKDTTSDWTSPDLTINDPVSIPTGQTQGEVTDTAQITGTGPAHLYSLLIGQVGSHSVPTSGMNANDIQHFCSGQADGLSGLSGQKYSEPAQIVLSSAKQLTMAPGYGCGGDEENACIYNVDPQKLTTPTDPVHYQVNATGLDTNTFIYYLVAGSYEGDTSALSGNRQVCKLLSNVGSLPITSSQTTTGQYIPDSTFNASFGATAQNRSLLAFLFRVSENQIMNYTHDSFIDLANIPSPCDDGANYWDAATQVTMSAPWTFDSLGNGSGGGTTKPSTAVSSLKLRKVTGGFTATGTDNPPPNIEQGVFASGLCSTAPGTDITLGLTNGQGVISLSKAGLLGLCSAGIFGQVLKVMFILAGLFFTISTLTSGINLFRSTSDDELTKAKRNLGFSLVGAFLVLFANWLVPLFIELITKLVK